MICENYSLLFIRVLSGAAFAARSRGERGRSIAAARSPGQPSNPANCSLLPAYALKDGRRVLRNDFFPFARYAGWSVASTCENIWRPRSGRQSVDKFPVIEETRNDFGCGPGMVPENSRWYSSRKSGKELLKIKIHKTYC